MIVVVAYVTPFTALSFTDVIWTTKYRGMHEPKKNKNKKSKLTNSIQFGRSHSITENGVPERQVDRTCTDGNWECNVQNKVFSLHCIC
jgi:hypothetical protein